MPDSPDWSEYLIAVQTVLGHSLKINVLRERHLIHQFTAGVRRLFVQLFTLAYHLAWQNGKRHVTLEDLRAAYDHTEFTIGREQASAMLSPNHLRNQEYVCPFELPKVNAAAIHELQKQRKLEEITQTMQRDALPAEERKEVPTPVKQKTRRSPRKSVSKEELRQSHLRRQQQSPST